MKRVFKYPIPVVDGFTIDMPKGAIVLCVQTQREKPCIWALVDPIAPKETRHFRLAGTGHAINEAIARYVGTFQIGEGALVFHLFEDGVIPTWAGGPG